MDKMEQAIWIARSLFERGKVAGSAANMSFMDNDLVYITRSGGSFGTLTAEDFSVIDRNGTLISGKPASKEYPLHLMMYNRLPDVGAVLHTHSMYATMWSCMNEVEPGKPWPSYTPYLEMRLGSIGRIPYAKPGSKELFDGAAAALTDARGYLLENHGPIVAAKDLMTAFYDMEELEESARTAWLLRGTDARTI